MTNVEFKHEHKLINLWVPRLRNTIHLQNNIDVNYTFSDQTLLSRTPVVR